MYFEVPVQFSSTFNRADALVPFSPVPYLENRRCYVQVKHWSWKPNLLQQSIPSPFLEYKLECNLPQGQSQSVRADSLTDEMSIGNRQVPLAYFRVYKQPRTYVAAQAPEEGAKELNANCEVISGGNVEVFLPSGLQQIRFTVRPSFGETMVIENGKTTAGADANPKPSGWIAVHLHFTTLE